MKTMRTWIIVCSSVVVGCLVLVVLFVNIMHGFPWERKTADDATREYVVSSYGLTPVKTMVFFLFDERGEVMVSTKELEFTFDVFFSRRDLSVVHGDNHLRRLIEHNITQVVREDICSLLTGGDRLLVPFEGNTEGITIEDVNKDPNAVVEKFQDNRSYYIFIIRDVVKDGTVPSNNDYDTFKKLILKWKPSDITIWYKENGETFARLTIKHTDFDRIHNPDDLIPFLKFS